MVKENTMKQTEIGLIPEDWTLVRLDDVLLNYKLGGNYPTLDIPNQSPLIKMGNVGRGKINISKLEYIIGEPNVSDLLRYGDLLFNTRNTLELVGKVSIWRNELREAYYNSNLLKLIFKSKFVSSNFYINAVFNDKRIIQQLLNIATGTTSVAAIYTRDLLDIQIPLPPLAEQEAIATALSDCDAWIESLEQVIAKKRLIKQGAMQELLMAKEDWEVKKLGEVTNFKNGAAHENVVDENGEYIIVNSKFISQEGRVKKYSNAFLCPLFKGEIVMVMSDIPNGKALAKCFIIDHNNRYTLNQRICAFEANEDFNPKFLFYKINRNDYFLSFDSGSGQTNLRRDEVLNCPIFFPSLSEQTRIATILSDMDIEIEALTQKLTKVRQVKQGMMQELLTGKTRLV